MGRYAEHVYTDRQDIQHLEHLITQLPSEAEVELTLTDGRRLCGTVAERPALQLYRDAQEREGNHGVLRLDDAQDPAQTHMVWLDRIAQVRRLGSA